MNDNLVEEYVEIDMDSERSIELAMTFEGPHSESVCNYLKQWPEGPVEPQEMADRMNGMLLAAEANLRASIYVAATSLGVHPATVATMSISRVTQTILESALPGETVQ